MNIIRDLIAKVELVNLTHKIKKYKLVWVCRDCKKVYSENGDGLNMGTNPSGDPLRKCVCGGIVDMDIAEKSSKEYQDYLNSVHDPRD